jgi:putative tryptophan/tyrosine transport system substrate-binding protein
MRRREFMRLLGGAAALPLVARAQQPKRIPQIGLFLPPPRNSDVDEFLAGLRDFGWIEGETIHLEYRDAGGDDSRMPALAAELVAMNVAVLATAGTPGIYAAHRATTTIPIVAISGPDLVAMGLAASLSRPGGNITGQFQYSQGLYAKRLGILKNAIPSMTLTGALMVRGWQSNALAMSAMGDAARTLKLVLRRIEVGGLGEIEGALSDAGADPLGGVAISDHPLFITNPSEVAVILQKHGLPSIAAPVIAAHGALLGYGVDYGAVFRHAAFFVDKILKGAKPSDIPIEQTTKFRTVVNLKTAKAIGVEIPPLLLAAADEVIE